MENIARRNTGMRNLAAEELKDRFVENFEEKILKFRRNR